MTQQLPGLTFAPTSSRGEYVAVVRPDAATDTVWEIHLTGSIDGEPRQIKPTFCVVDNVTNSAGVLAEFDPFDIWVPAYSRRTLRIPQNSQIFRLTLQEGEAVVPLYFSEHNPNLPDETNQAAISGAEGAVKIQHVAVTASRAQLDTDAGKYIDLIPTSPTVNFVYALLPAATAGAGWYNARVANRGSEIAYVSPYGSETINGVFTAAKPLLLYPGESVDLGCDGATWGASEPNPVKAAGFLDWTGATHVLAAGSKNVENIARLGTGRYRINFACPMPHTDYAVIATCSQGTASTCIVTEDQSAARMLDYIILRVNTDSGGFFDVEWISFQVLLPSGN